MEGAGRSWGVGKTSAAQDFDSEPLRSAYREQVRGSACCLSQCARIRNYRELSAGPAKLKKTSTAKTEIHAITIIGVLDRRVRAFRFRQAPSSTGALSPHVRGTTPTTRSFCMHRPPVPMEPRLHSLQYGGTARKCHWLTDGFEHHGLTGETREPRSPSRGRRLRIYCKYYFCVIYSPFYSLYKSLRPKFQS